MSSRRPATWRSWSALGSVGLEITSRPQEATGWSAIARECDETKKFVFFCYPFWLLISSLFPLCHLNQKDYFPAQEKNTLSHSRASMSIRTIQASQCLESWFPCRLFTKGRYQ